MRFIAAALEITHLSHNIMEVFAVTIFVSLMFAVLFAALFVAERSQHRRNSVEQDALLPFDELVSGRKPERPAKGAAVLAPVPVTSPSPVSRHS